MTSSRKGIVDNLSMTYDGNMLASVSDSAPAPSVTGSADFRDGVSEAVEYTYGRNGNGEHVVGRNLEIGGGTNGMEMDQWHGNRKAWQFINDCQAFIFIPKLLLAVVAVGKFSFVGTLEEGLVVVVTKLEVNRVDLVILISDPHQTDIGGIDRLPVKCVPCSQGSRAFGEPRNHRERLEMSVVSSIHHLVDTGWYGRGVAGCRVEVKHQHLTRSFIALKVHGLVSKIDGPT